jgi:hypothetical protein
MLVSAPILLLYYVFISTKTTFYNVSFIFTVWTIHFRFALELALILIDIKDYEEYPGGAGINTRKKKPIK